MTGGALAGCAGSELRRAAGRPDHPGRRRGRRTHPRRGDRQRALRRRPRGVALGRVAGLAAAVSCLGPLAGGVIEGLLGWRAVIALPMLGALLLPLLWRSLPTDGSGARLDLLGAALVAATAAGVVLLVQSPSTGPVVAVVGGVLAVLGVPAVARWIRRRPNGFLPVSVIRNPVGRAQRARRRRGARRLVRPAHRRAGRARRPRLGAVAGRRGADTQRGDRPARAPRRRARCSTGSARRPRSAWPRWSLRSPWASRRSGAHAGSAVLLVTAVVGVTFAFGLGQPALMEAVGDAVADDVRGVALGIATLFFLVGGGVGSAVVGGLGDVLGMARRAAAPDRPAAGGTGAPWSHSCATGGPAAATAR